MWKDSETEIDYLDYGYIVDILKDIICNDELLPASIGLYGDWGSGKSSLMHMCIMELENGKKAKCLIFNGWLFENYSDAKTALLNGILDAIAQDKSVPDKAKDILKGLYKSVDKFKVAQRALKYGAEFALTGGIGTLVDITSNTVLNIIKNQVPELIKNIDTEQDRTSFTQSIKDELDEKSLREDIREFQKQFDDLIKESKIERLVIFIDELDRCREDTILDTLEAMKLFMFTGKVAFVIGADERHISYAVKSKFKDIEGIQIDIGKEYLEKLVQYPIHIPRMDIDATEVYIASLLLSSEVSEDTFSKFQEEIIKSRKSDFLVSPLKNVGSINIKNDKEDAIFKEGLSIAKQLAAVLSNGLHGNPRQVKRFLNTLDMRMKMSEYKHAEIDRKILAKLMILEYIRPAAFNLFAEMTTNGEINKELAILESKDANTELGNLKLRAWLRDEWLLNWISIEPPLADQELIPYFYFTRTSLDEKISRKSVNLSPEAQVVFEKLLSKSDVKIKEAIETDVSDAEAGIILELMNSKMTKDTKIDKMHIKAFTSFAAADSARFITGLEYIKLFSPSALSTSSAIYLADFAKKTDLISEMQEVAKVWGKSNENLEKVFNNSLKGK